MERRKLTCEVSPERILVELSLVFQPLRRIANMKTIVIRFAVTGAALLWAIGGVAEAAKGVKKVAPANNTPRIVTGVVTHVVHKKNGTGIFHVRTAHHHRKLAQTVTTGTATTATTTTTTKPQYHNHEFHVTPATQFTHANGTPVSFAALRLGERVRVQATGNNATAVHILSHHRIRGTFVRYRTRFYNPYVVHPYRRMHMIRPRP